MIRSAHRDAPVYETRDGSLIRELMHPAVHGNRAQSLAEATIRPGQTIVLGSAPQAGEFYSTHQR